MGMSGKTRGGLAGTAGLAFVLALVLAGCGTTSSRNTAADLAEITAFNARYLKSINDEDIATLSSLTTDDVTNTGP